MKIKKGNWYLTDDGFFLKVKSVSGDEIRTSIAWCPKRKGKVHCSLWTKETVVRKMKQKELNPYLEYFI